MIVWEGYPHSRTALAAVGMYRWTDYDGTGTTVSGPCAASTTFVEVPSDRNCDRVYLKWFGDLGAYYYWLSEPYFKDRINVRSIGDIQSHFIERNVARERVHELGHDSNPTKEIVLKFDESYLPMLRSLPESPEVYMYTGAPGSGEIEWCKVKVAGTRHDAEYSKSNNVEWRLTLELPERYTVKLI